MTHWWSVMLGVLLAVPCMDARAQAPSKLDTLLEQLAPNHAVKERRAAVQELRRLILDGKVQDRQNDVARALLGAVADDNDELSRDAVDGLAWLGEPALEPMLDILRHNHKHGRSDVAGELGSRMHMHPKLANTISRKATPVLAQFINDPEPALKRNAIASLAWMGPVAIPHLVKVLADPKFGATAAQGIARHGAKGVKDLVRSLDGDNFLTRYYACDALRRIGAPAKGAVAPLTRLLTDKDPRLRQGAASALGAIGPEARAAVPALIRLAAREQDCAAALFALSAIRLTQHQVPDLLAGLPAVKTEAVLYHAADALATAGATGVPELVKVLKDKRRPVRKSAVLALIKLGPQAANAEPVLNELLADKDMRLHAVDALLALGASAKRAIPLLVKDLETDGRTQLLRTAEYRHDSPAAARLGKIGTDALPALLDGLETDRQLVRLGSLVALGMNGAKAKTALPKISRLLATTGDAMEREIAVGVFRQIDRVALDKMLKDAGLRVPENQHWSPRAIAPLAARAARKALENHRH